MAEAAQKIPVTLTDGRVVEFGAKQKLQKNSTIAEDGTVTTELIFKNGEIRTFTPPAALIARFVAHGVEQKLGDCIAGETDPDDQVLAVEDLIARLSAGEWNIGRSSAGSFAGTSILARALVEVSGKTAEEIKTYLSTKSQAEKIALRGSEKLRPVIQRLEAEKQSKSKTSVDTDSLLGELGLDSSPKKAKSE